MLQEVSKISENTPKSDDKKSTDLDMELVAAQGPEKVEDIEKTADNFISGTSKEEMFKYWQEKYQNDPLSFFTEENYKNLAALTGEERLSLLSFVASSIIVTPQLASNFYKKFPSDLKAVDKIFRNNPGPRNMLDHYLYTISALDLDSAGILEFNDSSDLNFYQGKLEQFYNIARRRQEAPKFLLQDFKEVSLEQDLAEFGPAGKNVLRVVELAENRDKQLDISSMFSNDFEKLSEEDKARFLQKCLGYFQNCLLFEEVYNSGFTPEHVDYYNNKNRRNILNPTHSIIYRTYQPASAYETKQGDFDWQISNTPMHMEEYADYKMILAILNKLKNSNANQDKNTELVVDFWNKNRNPIFANAVADVLSAQNANLAASELLKLLKTEKDKKEPIVAMLYRLEFGKIGISEEGVRYLEKVYDLGEYNNPDYHANRLTPDGDIGVFNEDLELIKYFHLTNLDSDENKIPAQVLDFTYNTLFIGQPGESTEERTKREEYLNEFKKNYYRISEEEIFKKIGLHLNNLSFKEQGWFLIYFDQADAEKKEKLLAFISNHKEDGIKSFLALETDKQLGEKLLNLSSRLDRDSAAIFFHQLSEMTDLAEKENSELKKLFLKDGEECSLDWTEVRLGLLRKANEIITNFNQESEGPQANRNLLKALENGKAEISLLASVLKEAKKENLNINLETIKNLNLSVKEFNETMPSADCQAVLNMAQENWHNFGNKKMEKAVISGLEKSLRENENQKAYTLKYRDRVIGFVRFEKTDNNSLYAGSFNVSNDLRGLSIGQKMMESVLVGESENNILEATASIKIPAGCAYVEKIGFVADGIIDNYHSTGESLFSIKLDKEKNKKYGLRSEGKEQPIVTEDLISAVDDYHYLDNLIGRPSFVLCFDLKTEMEEYNNTLKRLLSRVSDNLKPLEDKKGKYTLTRYFYDKEKERNENVRYLVFEKNN